jgi:CMP-N-acetylneuraminic acid synthetase
LHKSKPKISVIVTAHNYGRYLSECLDSIIRQTIDSCEIIIVDDGSTDNTDEMLRKYEEHIDKIIKLNGVGVAVASNEGIKNSSGEYVIRLDADDYFVENILQILLHNIEHNDALGMVYPDYYVVNEEGDILECRRYGMPKEEEKLLERTPLGSCALFRRSCYDEIGGYDDSLRFEEDYDFWLRFIKHFKIKNIDIPLFYYRRHGKNKSENFYKRRQGRRYIKKRFVENVTNKKPKVAAIIPVRFSDNDIDSFNLRLLDNHPIFSYAIEAAKKCDIIDKIIVSTNSEEVQDLSKKYGVEAPFIRPKEISKRSQIITPVLKHAVDFLHARGNNVDIVVQLSALHPFIDSEQIEEAVYTMLIHECDSVISVIENNKYHWYPSINGISPVLDRIRFIKEEKDMLFEENGALHVFKPDNVTSDANIFGKTVSFILMSTIESVVIDSEYKLWFATESKKVIDKYRGL